MKELIKRDTCQGARHLGCTTGRAVIKLADAWDNALQIEIEPLIELIHIREVEDG